MGRPGRHGCHIVGAVGTVIRRRRGGGGCLLLPRLLLTVGVDSGQIGRRPGSGAADGSCCVSGRSYAAGHTAMATAYPVAVACRGGEGGGDG